MDRLFDPEALERPEYFVFVSMPMTNGAEKELKHHEWLSGEVDQGLQSARQHDPSWTLKAIAGHQHSDPRRGKPGGLEALEWVRRAMVRRAHGCVIVLHRESAGCGRELGLALQLGLPVLVMHPERYDPGIHAYASKFEGPLTARKYSRDYSVSEIVTDWIAEHGEDIRRQPERRELRIRLAEPTRRQYLSAFSVLSDAGRQDVAQRVSLDVNQLANILADSHEYSIYARALDLGLQLGVLQRPAEPAGPFALLPHEFDALSDAIVRWKWDGPTTARVVSYATEAVAGSDNKQRRLRLSDARSWKRLLDLHEKPDVRSSGS